MADVAGTALVDLLSQQQAAVGESGMRLSLHPYLMEPLALQSWPFHYAAATGHIDVAVALYHRGFWHATPLTIATLCSAGVGGTTPWSKPVSATPADVARLAGHGRAAQVLELMEARVPLRWSPRSHGNFPRAFQRAARRTMHALCTAGWFIHLPGPARTAITADLMQQLATRMVWNVVEPAEWAAARKCEFGDKELDTKVQALLRAVCPPSKHTSGGACMSQRRRQTPSLQRSSTGGSHTVSDDDGEDGVAGWVAGVPAAGLPGLGGAGHPPLPEGGGVGALGGFHFRLTYAAHPRQRGLGWAGLLLRSAVSMAAVAMCVCKRDQRMLLLAYMAGTFAGAGFTLPGTTLLLAHLVGAL